MPDNSNLSLYLRWEKSGSLGRSFILRGNEDIATLQFPRLLSDQAMGNIDGRSYHFNIKGIFRRTVTIIQDPFDHEVATMKLISRGGELEFIDGRRFTLTEESLFKRSWKFKDEYGKELVSFNVPVFKSIAGEVRTSTQVMSEKMLPLLLFAGWYAIVLFLASG
ncbi:MAG: hypothetical protein GX369_02230 [Euryarchaeota archaeon]|nr:hypothetical protein [Euryarchaeota archaeon]